MVTAVTRSGAVVALGDLSRHLRALLEQGEDVGGVARVGLAGGGRPDAPAGALGEIHSELALEGGNRGGDRGLGHNELLGGAGHRPVAKYRKERRELGHRDGHAKSNI